MAYFKRHPGRFRMVHMKDVAADGSVRDPGTGLVDFRRIIPAAEKAGSSTSSWNTTCPPTRYAPQRMPRSTSRR
ncbi:hypothetical protein ACFSLT_28030 [Novosphingobium resinovorum]